MPIFGPTRRQIFDLAVYLIVVVLLSTAVGWSALQIGAALIRLAGGGVKVSHKVEPEAVGDAVPFTATSTPLPVLDTTYRLIAPPTRVSSDYSEMDLSVSSKGTRGTYRTYCVRLCDGYYWPISFSATSDRLARDDAVCQSGCDSAARLFVHSMPRGGPATMVSLDGRPYAALKTAFSFRSRYDAECRCRPNPWNEAANDRHRLFAAIAAARKGDGGAAAEAKNLSTKIDAERTSARAARAAANAQAEHELASINAITKPEVHGSRRMGLGLDTGANRQPLDQPVAAETSRGGFSSASGNGRGWTSRVFEGN